MNLDQIWSMLQSSRASKDIIPLTSPIKIPNSFTHKEYNVTHSFTDSKSAFIGHDNSGNRFHIKIFGVPSFNQVKIINKNLKLVDEHAEDLRMIRIVDIIEFFDCDRWIMVLITPYIEGFTIDELSEGCHDMNFHLAKETSIKIFLQILDAIKAAQEKGLRISTLPDNIFLTKGSDPDFPFELKILPSSLHLLSCGKSKLEKIYPKDLKKNNVDGNIWGAGLCLYAFVGEKKLKSLSCLVDYNDKERQDQLQFYYKDEALTYIIKHSLNTTKPTSFAKHPILVYWRELLNKNWEAIEKFSVKQFNAFLSGLTFESLHFRLNSVKILLILACDNYIEVCSNLTKSDLLYTFVENCLQFDWYSNPDLINSVLLILKEKIISRTFKEKLISMNFLLIFKLALNLRARQELIFDFIQNFFEDNTLTILQIIKDEEFLKGILDKPIKTSEELKFLMDTMSYYGPYSVELIKTVYETTDIPEKRIIQHLHEIPYMFKQDKSQLVISIIQKILERNARIQGDSTLDMLKTIVHILAEILVIPKLFQYHHVVGLCTNQSDKQFLTQLSRSRLLIKCRTCGHVFCAICKQRHPADHDIQYVLYQNPLSLCSTKKSEELHVDISWFQLPKYSKITFIDTNEITYKNLNVRFIGPASSRITTLEPIASQSLDQSSTIVYFEVKVNSAGLQENIEVGVDGTGIVYKSTDGGVYKHGSLVAKAPRFGSYDVVGIGVTGNGKVYITYHGLVIWPMIDCEIKGEIRPFVVLGCDHCDVEVQMRNVVFQPPRETSPNQEFFNSEVLTISDKVLVNMMKMVKKSFRKNQNDPKSKDLYEKYCELLRVVRKFDLLDKIAVNKSRFWPR